MDTGVAGSALCASFLLCLWRDQASEDANERKPNWMGELVPIQSGRSWQSQGLEPPRTITTDPHKERDCPCCRRTRWGL